jgi:DNA-binding SARP family transcriptional activator
MVVGWQTADRSSTTANKADVSAAADPQSGQRPGRSPPSRFLLQLLQLGDYEQLAQLVRQFAGTAAFESGQTTADLIQAASWMCEVCLEARREAGWHEDALTRLIDREHALTEVLGRLLSALGPAETSSAPAGQRTEADFTISGPEGPKGTSRGDELCPFASLEDPSPVISVHALGPFEVFFEDQLIEDWQNGKGKSIFKFLVARRDRMAGKEVLMEYFWPEATPHASRNSLNVAIYGLRRTFSRIDPASSVVVFDNDCYLINPELRVWTDYETFLKLLSEARAFERDGETSAAAHCYECAETLYRGDFFDEDRYEDWTEPLRSRLRDDFLGTLDRQAESSFERGDYDVSIKLSSRMLELDPCHEAPRRRLMRCWSRQGLPHLSAREYQLCKDALEAELGLLPTEETTRLYEHIRRHEPI